MGKPTGFMEFGRKDSGYRDVAERLNDYGEFTIPLEQSGLREQGARCMDCGIPFCHSDFGCPVYNLIPEWNDLIYRDLWQEAYERLEQTNNFPEITGRVCPAPCETACTLSINDSPVTIKQIELAIIENAFKMGWVLPRKPDTLSGKSAAIVGSGPAGLAAAQQLCRLGHQVTVFEKAPKAGGLLRYGIPDFKLEKWVLDRRLKLMEAEGVNFETGVKIGEDLSAKYLVRSHDVVLITMGAERPRDLDVPGRECDGIHFAMDYLTRSNLSQDGLIEDTHVIDAKGKKVLVIGGGDTGSDCVGTANRQGASEIHQFEILEKPTEWPHASNPDWPNWPDILRTSSSHEEGCKRDWGILTKGFEKSDNHALKGSFSRVTWKTNADGRPPVLTEIDGSRFELECDLVLLAMGFISPVSKGIIEELELKTDSRGNISTCAGYQTSRENVFSAGDASTGASLVVKAIYHGREAARSIHSYLSEK